MPRGCTCAVGFTEDLLHPRQVLDVQGWIAFVLCPGGRHVRKCGLYRDMEAVQEMCYGLRQGPEDRTRLGSLRPSRTHLLTPSGKRFLGCGVEVQLRKKCCVR